MKISNIVDNKEFKVIIAGSRKFDNYNLLRLRMNELLYKKLEQSCKISIISGAASGADTLGERYAKENGYALIIKPANWALYGKSAGFIRNKEMANIADACVVFWDGVSKGSKHMIDIAEQIGIQLKIVYVGNIDNQTFKWYNTLKDFYAHIKL